jgi:hypothetical protein
MRETFVDGNAPPTGSNSLTKLTRPESCIRFHNKSAPGSYIYFDSDASDLDESAAPNNKKGANVSDFGRKRNCRQAIAGDSNQSSILSTLQRLSEMWNQENESFDANGISTKGCLEPHSMNLGPVAPSVRSLDGTSTVKTKESTVHNIEPGITTTLMIRNIPLRFTPVSFRELIDNEGFSGRYDYLYMPMDFRSHRSLGYCFMNFYDPDSAVEFTERFAERMFPSTNSDKVLAISAAARQGLLANVSSFKLSTLKQMPKVEFRPVVGVLGQLFPLDERVYSWLISGEGTSSNVQPAAPQGLSALYGFSIGTAQSTD